MPIDDKAYGKQERHTLDIYPRPAGQVAPIVVTVHGGGWIGGDNSGKRITCITQELAALGFAVFSINYRQATPEQDGVPMQTNRHRGGDEVGQSKRRRVRRGLPATSRCSAARPGPSSSRWPAC